MSTRRRRSGVTALAVMAPVLVWLVADPLLGHRLQIADDQQTLDIGAVPVAVVALLASLLGWGLLAALERFGVRRARAIWAGVAGVVLAASFLPFIGDGMDGGTRVSLALMHLAVAAVLIPGLGGRTPGAGAGTARGDRRQHRVRREQQQRKAALLGTVVTPLEITHGHQRAGFLGELATVEYASSPVPGPTSCSPLRLAPRRPCPPADPCRGAPSPRATRPPRLVLTGPAGAGNATRL